MTEIHGKVKTSQSIGGKVSASSAVVGEINKDVKDRLYKDYNLLRNKPLINGVELKDNKSLEELGIERFLYGTVEYWNSYPTLIAEQGTVYVYTDYSEVEGQLVPNFKIGDGTSYLLDMPFVSANMDEHIQDEIRHITQSEREKWNNKVSVSISALDDENLVFTIG